MDDAFAVNHHLGLDAVVGHAQERHFSRMVLVGSTAGSIPKNQTCPKETCRCDLKSADQHSY
jgi:hypothetical protein